MTSDQNLALYTKLFGFRLVVLANRFGCDTDVWRKLHERLLEGLEAAAGRIRTITALERAGDDEYAGYRLEDETEIFWRFTIILLDELDIDFNTHEYRVNGGDWSSASDYTGIDIDYPELVPLTEQELGSLVPILKELAGETGIAVMRRVQFTPAGTAHDRSGRADRFIEALLRGIFFETPKKRSRSMRWRSVASPLSFRPVVISHRGCCSPLASTQPAAARIFPAALRLLADQNSVAGRSSTFVSARWVRPSFPDRQLSPR